MIGPQGVFEMADVHGTFSGRWLEYEPTGERVEFKVAILFPFDAERRLFTGELVWFHGDDLFEIAGMG